VLHLLIERPGAAPLDRAFDADEVIVGRSDAADVPLDDSSVSRRHARFRREKHAWVVEDLGSRNGTELNGHPLAGAEPVQAGDVVRVGTSCLRIAPPAVEAARCDRGPVPSSEDDSVYSVLRPASELMRLGAADAASSRLKVLNEVHRALASPIARDELLQLILDRAFAVLQPEDAAIFLRGPDGELALSAERRSATARGPLLVSRRLAEEVTVKGAAALVLDAQSDERFAGARSVLASGVRSILAAPLLDADGCLGMIALYSRIHVRRFSEQDLELLVSLASAAALRIRNIDLAEAAARRRVLDRELALARDIQMAMLKRRPPEREEVELAARLVPARSVGGDFYDFLIDGDRLWFVVADVAGKGMAAALMMAVAQTLFRAVAPSGSTPSDVMVRLNRELARDNDRAMFVTALAGCLELTSGRVQLANAGHNLPYRLHRDGASRKLEAGSSIALGVVEEATFPITEFLLEPGDALFLYTDGVCDAVDPAGRAFGTASLEARLQDLACLPAGDIVHTMFATVDAFANRAPQEDDITVAVVRYRGRRALELEQDPGRC
jgi:serine phosphatase RsbU (regulator of sigma subunit)